MWLNWTDVDVVNGVYFLEQNRDLFVVQSNKDMPFKILIISVMSCLGGISSLSLNHELQADADELTIEWRGLRTHSEFFPVEEVRGEWG